MFLLSLFKSIFYIIADCFWRQLPAEIFRFQWSEEKEEESNKVVSEGNLYWKAIFIELTRAESRLPHYVA